MEINRGSTVCPRFIHGLSTVPLGCERMKQLRVWACSEGANNRGSRAKNSCCTKTVYSTVEEVQGYRFLFGITYFYTTCSFFSGAPHLPKENHWFLHWKRTLREGEDAQVCVSPVEFRGFRCFIYPTEGAQFFTIHFNPPMFGKQGLLQGSLYYQPKQCTLKG